MKKLIDFNSTDPQVVQRSKNIAVGLVFGIFFILITIGLSMTSNKSKDKIGIKTKAKNKVEIAKSINIKAEDAWLDKSESEIKDIGKAIKDLQEQNKFLQQQLQNQREQNNNLINNLTQEIANMNINQQQNYQPLNDNQSYDEFGEIITVTSDIQTINLDLDNTIGIEETNTYSDTEDYIPAGSYAKARMLSGADVSTGVNSQNDPNNMLFEIISPVSIPKYKGNSQEIKKIEGCRVSGAAVGQLWTEKAYIRLLKMTCSFEKGKVAEYNVKGYITSFAKEGVRGKIVSREGYFTSMAFLSGAIEGVAGMAKTAYSPTVDVSSGIATQTLNVGDTLKAGGASGFEKAASLLSEYYIKRAEQYQSVVDVPTGIEVELVFQEGVDLRKNTDFKIKPNEIGKQIGIQMGHDTNSQLKEDVNSGVSKNNSNNIEGGF
jgi:conjugal transfer pilus assembly protein TraB